jgi:hypothetical protein
VEENHTTAGKPGPSVADPDQAVFGPPGSGARRTDPDPSTKKNTKNLDLYDFLSLKTDVNVASKSNRQKTCSKSETLRGASKIKLKYVNKKRMATARTRRLIFFGISQGIHC